MKQLGGRLRWIAHGCEIDVSADKEATVRVWILIDAHAQDHQVGLVAMELNQGRQFDQAWSAPCRPEIEQHHLAAVLRQLH